MEARFAILDSTLTVPNYRVEKFRFFKKIIILNFLKIIGKITKNVISRKLQRVEQSYFEARFAIFESTLTGPNYKVGNFRFCEKKININFLKIFEKITKNVKSRKLQGFGQSYLEARFAILDSTLTVPNYMVEKFRFFKKIIILNFLKIIGKITKNVISRKLKRVEQSYFEARFAIFESTLTGPNYKVGNFRFCEKKLI